MDILVLNKELEIIGSFDNYEDLTFIRKLFLPGEFEFKIFFDRKQNYLFKCDNIIYIDVDKAGIINSIEMDRDENKKFYLTVSGVSIESILSDRIIIPPSGKEHEIFKGSAETVIKNFINSSFINPVEIDRKRNDLELVEDNQFGIYTEKPSRYGGLLLEVSEIAWASSLGLKLEIDLENKKYIFDVINGNDLTIGTKNQVVFSLEFDNITSFIYNQSKIGYKNFAYVAGPGEGINRIVTTVGANSGKNRKEMFVDARDLKESLEERGQAKLEELSEKLSFSCEIEPFKPFAYKKDWNLGDFVTILVDELDIDTNIQITEIKEEYGLNDNLTLTVVFGNKEGNILEKFDKLTEYIGTATS